jgi:hypothetical protein
MPKEGFRCAVEQHLTGKETEPWELIYFRIYKSQLPVVERALEVAGMMLGADKSRGYCLEMICADFLAGADISANKPDNQRIQLNLRQKKPRIKLDSEAYTLLRNQVLERASCNLSQLGRRGMNVVRIGSCEIVSRAEVI